MEQFNPSLRNFIATGKNYEKALAGVTYAAKGYFDALVKMGELASESQGSKELGDVLFQMAEVHRQIQNQLEETLKSFHNELLTQLEQKVELDSRYLSAALKKYQAEQRSKGDALDKCQAELKKLRKKSQGSKNPQKYSDKELQRGVWREDGDTAHRGQSHSGAWTAPPSPLAAPCGLSELCSTVARRGARLLWGCPELGVTIFCPPHPHQYIDAISSKQGELESYVSDGYKTALTEERRRFCFLVEKQCAVAKNSAAYHSKGKELLAQKLPLWQQACADPNKIPDRAVQLMQQMASSNGSILPSALSASKSNLVISDPIPGAKPLPVPPELAPFVGRLSAQENTPVMNGVSGPDSEDYSPWADRKATQTQASSPPQSQTKLSDSYSNTLPVRKSVAPKNSYATTENKTLPRSSSMAAGLERNGRMRVKAIFSHAAGDNSTLLSFKEGDLITLLVPEARDGWHYGESEKTKMRGWFPFSYTRVLDSDGSDRLHMSLQQGKSSSTGNLLDKEDPALPPPDYGTSSRAFPTQATGTFKQRPYSVAVPAFSQGLDDYGARAVSRAPAQCCPELSPGTRTTQFQVRPPALSEGWGSESRVPWPVPMPEPRPSPAPGSSRLGLRLAAAGTPWAQFFRACSSSPFSQEGTCLPLGCLPGTSPGWRGQLGPPGSWLDSPQPGLVQAGSLANTDTELPTGLLRGSCVAQQLSCALFHSGSGTLVSTESLHQRPAEADSDQRQVCPPPQLMAVCTCCPLGPSTPTSTCHLLCYDLHGSHLENFLLLPFTCLAVSLPHFHLAWAAPAELAPGPWPRRARGYWAQSQDLLSGPWGQPPAASVSLCGPQSPWVQVRTSWKGNPAPTLLTAPVSS
ncbi:LOW QUALITY PROTEIN: hypothetical protein MC885_006498 [Smutsia gigantea]|nr:LOW QUALITY PROTEIN: hypothetical protein MC885_006498 [Smutsia gigantea]